MPPILRTKKDDPARILGGVGVMPANGVGGIALERAAQSVPEFQDDKRQPLSGAALKKAGKDFADVRGLEVADVSEDKIAKLPELAGGFPDRPPAVEAAQENSFAQYAPTAQGDAPAGASDQAQS